MVDDSITRHQIQLSKFLSLVLRHKPQLLDLQIDKFGFTSIDIKSLAKRIRNTANNLDWVTEQDIRRVVKADKKGRYEIKNNKIRARYGHSLDHVQLLEDNQPRDIPEVLYHGTSPKAAKSILKEGLKSKNRKYVHLSEDKENAWHVGKRHANQPVILEIDVKNMLKEGIKVTHAGKSTYLTPKVPLKFIKKLEDH